MVVLWLRGGALVALAAGRPGWAIVLYILAGTLWISRVLNFPPLKQPLVLQKGPNVFWLVYLFVWPVAAILSEAAAWSVMRSGQRYLVVSGAGTRYVASWDDAYNTALTLLDEGQGVSPDLGSADFVTITDRSRLVWSARRKSYVECTYAVGRDGGVEMWHV